jgi:hypothetical protein
MALVVACVDVLATELKGAQHCFSFFNRWKGPPTHSGPFSIEIVVLTHAIAGVFEFVKGRWGRRATFQLGTAAPLIAFLPLSRSAAPAMLSRGSSNNRVIAAMGVHNAFAAFTIAMAFLWLPVPTASLMEGGNLIKNIDRNKALSGLIM